MVSLGLVEVNNTRRESRHDHRVRLAKIRGLKMRYLILAMAIVLLTCSVHAQEMKTGKGRQHQQDTQKTEDKAKRKADEKAYEDALKSIPESKEKLDPWKSMR